MLYALNAGVVNYVIDGAVLALVLVLAAKGARKGFVDCFFGFISTIVAIIAAFLLMKGVLSWTDGIFGLQGVIENAVVGSLGKVVGFDIDVSAAGIEAALADKNLPSFLVDSVVKSVGNTQLPQGTTLAMVVGGSIAEFAATLIAWLLTFIAVKLLLKLVRGVLTAVVEKLPLVGTLNHLLGFAVGGLQGLLIASGVIAVFALVPAEGLTVFFNECIVTGWLYNNNPIYVVFGWFIH